MLGKPVFSVGSSFDAAFGVIVGAVYEYELDKIVVEIEVTSKDEESWSDFELYNDMVENGPGNARFETPGITRHFDKSRSKRSWLFRFHFGV